jgi:heat shock protein HslJ/uncharacterized membrane protein
MAGKSMNGIIAVSFFCIFSFVACRPASKTTVATILATQHAIMPSDSMIQKQKKGIDLFATGTVPVSWSLEIDFDKQIVFNTGDGNSFNVLPAFENKEITGNSEIYSFRTDPGPVTIQVFNSSCAVLGSSEQYNKKVEVRTKNKLYTGCGKYLFDHRLNDSWILDMVNNIKQSPSDFTKGLPTLQFDLQKNKMSGSDGCNTISSNIEIQGNRIKFGSFISTKMACNNNKVENIFSGMLSDKLVDYYEENGRLILYLIDDSKLIFIRKSL